MTEEYPVPVPKPPVPIAHKASSDEALQADAPIALTEVTPYAHTEILSKLYAVKIRLAAVQRETAIRQLKDLKARTAMVESSSGKMRVMDMQYVSHGMLSHLLVPLSDGDARYATAVKAAKELKAHRTEPTEYSLMTLSGGTPARLYQEKIGNALKALQDQSVKDDSAATIAADRELDMLYQGMTTRSWQPGAKHLLITHTDICEQFMQLESWALAQHALEQAHEALAALRLMNREKELVNAYEARLTGLDDSLSQKNPSLFKRIGHGIDKLVRKAAD
ncbi:MAG: hypothetical protein CMM93_06220 [Rickettsiales bacterium]|nr:hypothetical protein [Rickettsiales bacterium]|tara:strand:+ start:3070 stop:3903 length:834 start_codon:yes stop_codon:yes gene_type:complete